MNFTLKFISANAFRHHLFRTFAKCQLSTSIQRPKSEWLGAVANSLGKMSLAFPLNADKAQIKPLFRPHQFYDVLMDSIESAQKEISLTALYMGTGEHERRIILALKNKLEVNPSLKVQLVFDGCRARRISPQGTTTLDLLQPLTKQFGDRVMLSLFTLPSPAATKLPSPADEVLGVFHMKVFAIDNEVIISGGNLSGEYFVDRQDRYVHFGSAGELASFYHEFIHRIGGCGEVVSGVPRHHSIDELMELLSPLNNERSCVDQSDDIDTWVYPTLQCAPLGVRQDEQVFKHLLQSSTAYKHLSLNIATAYLNPPDWVMDLLLKAAPYQTLNIMTAHPCSHGFRTAQGIMSVIPLCYQYLLTSKILPRFVQKPSVTIEGRMFGDEYINSTRFNFLSYARRFWTFHAKGLWIFENKHHDCDSKEGTNALATIVGSSNYGRRSFNLDLEAQAVVLTENRKLISKHQIEWDSLESHAKTEIPKPHFSTIKKIRVALTSFVMGNYL